MGELFTYVFNMVGQIKFTDVLDIAVITFLIYKLVGFLRETRAQQLIKGIMVIAAAYFASYFFDLKMIKFFIEILLKDGLLVLLIIFSPEIRKALETVGNSRLGKFAFFSSDANLKRQKTLVAVNGVIDAFKALRKDKMGALVVFEGYLSLNDVVKTGTIIDAAPSPSVIANLFFNHAPLHDGAIIIRNARVYAAGCILPLTNDNESVDQALGTRHRAAIGMSENADSVVAILSEETGMLSIAYNGKIARFNDISEFSETLITMVAPEIPESDNNMKSPFLNWIHKLLSFILPNSKKKEEDSDEK